MAGLRVCPPALRILQHMRTHLQLHRRVRHGCSLHMSGASAHTCPATTQRPHTHLQLHPHARHSQPQLAVGRLPPRGARAAVAGLRNAERHVALLPRALGVLKAQRLHAAAYTRAGARA